MADSLVIIDDIDLERVRRSPPEDNPPLAVDPDTPPTDQISLQSLQTVSRHCCKIVERSRRVKHRKPLLRALLYVTRQARSALAKEYAPRGKTAERLDHSTDIPPRDITVR